MSMTPSRSRLTLFCLPKKFVGHIAMIQRNALQSWVLLEPRCEVLALGNENGTAEICTELGLRHIPDVTCNEYGTPVVSDLFRAAEAIASGEIMAYVNADIILGQGFLQAAQIVFSDPRRHSLMVGRRVDLAVDEPIEYAPDWHERLTIRARREGRLHAASGIDYFVFRRGFWGEIPPFALGRTVWDNWLLFRARALGARVVDATDAVLAVHQDHDYGHHPEGRSGVWLGPEAQRNRTLAGSDANCLTIDDASHRLVNGTVRSAFTLFRLHRAVEITAAVRPRFAPLARVLLLVLKLSYPVRARLGLSGRPTGGRNAP